MKVHRVDTGKMVIQYEWKQLCSSEQRISLFDLKEIDV